MTLANSCSMAYTYAQKIDGKKKAKIVEKLGEEKRKRELTHKSFGTVSSV